MQRYSTEAYNCGVCEQTEAIKQMSCSSTMCVFVFVCWQLAGSVTEAQSHDEGRGERRVTRVHGSVTGKGTKSF